MRYMLITVRNIFHVEIITKIYGSKEDAVNQMKTELYNRLKIDGDEKKMEFLESGIELSNAVLHENDAYIYQDFGNTFHHWEIVEVQKKG